ncbi:hypothetical protein GGP41_000933 [Bipolaris sorokiniana]|uniref:Uncharacterized protein n=1 Tax=Cochliobolus sativus TaxID=45130 RepID=A0A8H5ZQV2_COCSA|nr:hypothetical protein GGP41_000933 [Bipolaris sorokiniana]
MHMHMLLLPPTSTWCWSRLVLTMVHKIPGAQRQHLAPPTSLHHVYRWLAVAMQAHVVVSVSTTYLLVRPHTPPAAQSYLFDPTHVHGYEHTANQWHQSNASVPPPLHLSPSHGQALQIRFER